MIFTTGFIVLHHIELPRSIFRPGGSSAHGSTNGATFTSMPECWPTQDIIAGGTVTGVRPPSTWLVSKRLHRMVSSGGLKTAPHHNNLLGSSTRVLFPGFDMAKE
ncbi:hypothetical protein L13192_03637 [Pyrenophora tritici-repentis]|nr:hypothetical protein Ptr86124_006370 [Pyrenophora tritici-repentis]KAI1672778.1 hypothetical protein L13192_03637 [Pyrenophora tritici-repentis]KAI1676055.1 hypothetical protein KJE20_14355 [Pyrenophora tritici-repentis]KAI1677427.1 hypothetical protein KJE20_13516 [Pyrenophora tritici-repentis]KAI1686819.1 hypothetical protein KJE20_04784 [Pyrenophora tritici-repentis]